MLQKHIDKLQKLGFTGDLDSIRPVLEMRAYHNTYDDASAAVTDRSYAVLNIPQCYDEETEEILRGKTAQLLFLYRSIELNEGSGSPVPLPPPPKADQELQFEYQGAMSREEITAKFLELSDTALDGLRSTCDRFDPSDPADQCSIDRGVLIETRLEVIRTLIEAGCTTYAYTEQCYDWLE